MSVNQEINVIFLRKGQPAETLVCSGSLVDKLREIFDPLMYEVVTDERGEPLDIEITLEVSRTTLFVLYETEVSQIA
jgi:hypothetical protein